MLWGEINSKLDYFRDRVSRDISLTNSSLLLQRPQRNVKPQVCSGDAQQSDKQAMTLLKPPSISKISVSQATKLRLKQIYLKKAADFKSRDQRSKTQGSSQDTTSKQSKNSKSREKIKPKKGDSNGETLKSSEIKLEPDDMQRKEDFTETRSMNELLEKVVNPQTSQDQDSCNSRYSMSPFPILAINRLEDDDIISISEEETDYSPVG